MDPRSNQQHEIIENDGLPQKTNILPTLTKLMSEREKIEVTYQQAYLYINTTPYYTAVEASKLRKEYADKERAELMPYIQQEQSFLDLILQEAHKERKSYDELFSTTEFKFWIRQRNFYYNLKHHIEKNDSNTLFLKKPLVSTKRQDYFAQLEKMIDLAGNAEWIFTMDETEHPLNKLSSGSKATDETRKIIHHFKMNIALYILQKEELKMQGNEKESNALSHHKHLDRYFYYNKPTVTQRLRNWSAKTIINRWEHLYYDQNQYDEIGQSGILLGIIPTVSLIKQIEKKYQKNITIISIIDKFEFTTGKDTIQPYDCQKHGWRHFDLPMTDYTQDMESENLLAAAKAIDEAKQRGDIVYIHCKAGKARSALVLAIYYAVHDKNFINSLLEDVQTNPGRRLNAAVKHIKGFRPQVDLHDELIDQYDINAWLVLDSQTDKLQDEIKKMFPKKNIGKLCNGCKAISLAMSLEQQQLNVLTNDLADDFQEHFFASKKFKNELVQSFAFKELEIFIWRIQKYDLGKTVRVNYLDNFLEDLKKNSAHAIGELQYNFGTIDSDTNIGKLLLNSKADAVIGILQRLYMGVQNYSHFNSFEPTLTNKLNMDNDQLNQYFFNIPLQVETKTKEIILKLSGWCDTKNNADLQQASEKLTKFLASPSTPFLINNLDQACQVYEMYQTMKEKNPQWNSTLRKEALERVGYPFGIILAGLNPNNVNEKSHIDNLLNLDQTWISELQVLAKKHNILSQRDPVTLNAMLNLSKSPPLSRHNSGLFAFTPQNNDRLEDDFTQRLTFIPQGKN